MKKVLIITYYWPPAGGPGVQRWLKFVKYLKSFDVEPVVYIPSNPTYPIIDESLKTEVPGDLRILSTRIFEPYAIAELFSGKKTRSISSGIIKKEENQTFLVKALLYIRGNFFMPDARKFWIKPSVKYLEQEINNENYDLIITTGPPHSLHLIGLELKENTGIKWLADFRDPWTNIGYHSKLRLSKGAREKHEKLELAVLQNADHLVTTSFTTKEEFSRKTGTPITVITNGYDIDPESQYKPADSFEVSHIGSLLSGRNPEQLWQALAELTIENAQFRQFFTLNLVGKVSEEVLESITQTALTEYLALPGYVTHTAAVDMQRNASVLLLLEIDSEETKGIIPGKLFEYLAARKPVLAIGPQQWDAGRIVEESASGIYLDYTSKEEIKAFIMQEFEKFLNNEQQLLENRIDKYHRKALTKNLAELINSM
ncbi:glycosyltransferase family 4 protein [Christiangramia aquimixticola]|uniref:glycosyltransferase family 4 protein n=1 Tax=Christiangramia aquimixticola TaxID=1697558 RepID=UPI003AA962E4